MAKGQLITTPSKGKSTPLKKERKMTISKKDKRAQKRQNLLDKLEVHSKILTGADPTKKTKESPNKNKKTAKTAKTASATLLTLQDMISPLLEASLTKEITSKPTKSNQIKKITESERKLHQDVLSHPAFKSNPLAAITEHVKNSVELEKKMKEKSDKQKLRAESELREAENKKRKTDERDALEKEQKEKEDQIQKEEEKKRKKYTIKRLSLNGLDKKEQIEKNQKKKAQKELQPNSMEVDKETTSKPEEGNNKKAKITVTNEVQMQEAASVASPAVEPEEGSWSRVPTREERNQARKQKMEESKAKKAKNEKKSRRRKSKLPGVEKEKQPSEEKMSDVTTVQ